MAANGNLKKQNIKYKWETTKNNGVPLLLDY